MSERDQHGSAQSGLCQGVILKTKSTLVSDSSFKQVFSPEHLVDRGATPGDVEAGAVDLEGDAEFVVGGTVRGAWRLVCGHVQKALAREVPTCSNQREMT